MSSDRLLPLLDDVATLLLSGATVAIIALLAADFVAAIHLPTAPAPDGAYGWAIAHHYSKQQELLTYGFVLFVAVCAARLMGLLDARLRSRAANVRGALMRIAVAAPLLACGVALAAQPGPPPAYVDTVVALVLALGAFVLAVRAPAAAAPPAPAVEPVRARPPAGSDERFRAAAGIAAVVVLGTMAGWFLVTLLPPDAWAAQILRYAIPLAALGGIAVSVGRGASLASAAGTAAIALLPVILLVLIPALGVAIGSILVLVVAALVLFGLRDRRIGTIGTNSNAVALAAAIAFAAFGGVTAWAQNPRFLAGLLVSPLDGDAAIGWLHEVSRGHLLYRDFWYPYGPLDFLVKYAGVMFAGLDRYDSVSLIIMWTFCAAAAVVVVTSLLGRRLIALAAVPFLFFGFIPEPRVWIGLAAFAVCLAGLRRSSRGLGISAGILLGASALWSPEVFISATVALIAMIAYLTWRDGKERLRDAVLIGAASGLGGTLGLGAIVGIATGTLAPFVSSMTRILGVVDTCCAQPYPSVFGGLNAMGDAPTSALDPHFVNFYLVPAVYVIAIVTLVMRRGPVLRLCDADVALAAVALFGIVLFRSALSRTDGGHLAFVAVPAGVVAVLLVARAVTAWRSRPAAAGAAVMLLLAWPAPRDAATTRLAGAERYMETLPLALSVQRRDPPPGWTEIATPRGARLWFLASDADDTSAVVDWLRVRLRPEDTIYAIPWAARYEVLLDRTSPTDAGPQMWGAIATARDQRQLVESLQHVRYVIYDEAEWPNVDGVGWIDRYSIVAHALVTEFKPVAVFGSKIVYEHGTPPGPRRSLALGDTLSAEALLGGWYAAEDPHNLRARWTAPLAELVLRQEPGDDAIAIDYETFDQPSASRTLKVSVDDHVVGTTPLVAGRHHDVFSLSGRTGTGRTATIQLESTSPLDAHDLRALGVLVYEVRFGTRPSLSTGIFPAPLAAAPVRVTSGPIILGGGAVSLDTAASRWDRGTKSLHVRIRPVTDVRTIEWVQLLVNTAITGANGCYLSVIPPSHSLFFAKDVGSDWFPPEELGAHHQHFANSQCTVDPSQAHSRIEAGMLDVTVSVDLVPAFAKRLPHAWVLVKPAQNAQGNWVQLNERAAH